MLLNKKRLRSASARLRHLLKGPDIIMMAACYDALSARLVEAAGFPVTFMSGFGVAASRLGFPDTGLISYGEMLDQGRNICGAVSIPVLGDGDTGFGNALNVKRTVHGYHQAGFACIMIEDQRMPKRCGHTAGKEVVDSDEACLRLRAAVDARREGADILIMARTDARATHGLGEAIERCRAFYRLGADITFLEAPQSEAEMRQYCENVPGPKMANLLEQGKTPMLSPDELQAMGYRIGVYPLTLLNASVTAMQAALAHLKKGRPAPNLMDFEKLRKRVGFDDYDNELRTYHLN
ncbi:MAG: carboxyvinyl-carboxyphosphonate phosphorylmutase [Deltaproteobacteria bacterium]|nr:MAG: carboxyvinyl-carboxyphosphonate phosphorylmutase [Deltaproteobacteria bacterium]